MSLFVHITVVPTLTVRVTGWKPLLVRVMESLPCELPLAGCVWVALVCFVAEIFAQGVELVTLLLDPRPRILPSPECTPQEERKRAIMINSDSIGRCFILLILPPSNRQNYL